MNLLTLLTYICLLIRSFVYCQKIKGLFRLFLFFFFSSVARRNHLWKDPVLCTIKMESGSEYLDKCIMSSILNDVLNNSRWHLQIQNPQEIRSPVLNRKETDQHLRNESEKHEARKQGGNEFTYIFYSLNLFSYKFASIFSMILLKGPFQSCCPQNSVNFSGKTKKKQTIAKEKEAHILFRLRAMVKK